MQDLIDAIGIITKSASQATAAAASKAEPDGFYGAMLFNAKTPSDLSISGTVSFPNWSTLGSTPLKPATPKPTAPVRDIGAAKQPKAVLLSALLASQSQSATSGGDGTAENKSDAQENSDSSTAVSSGPVAKCPSPSTKGSQEPACTVSVTALDEDLHHWDISFGVPFKTVTDLQYLQPTGNSSSVLPKTVTRLNAYAFADIFLSATDIISPPLVTWPHIALGLPISGKVFNRPIFTVGDGFNFSKISALKVLPLHLSFFGGEGYFKEFRQIPGTTGAANVRGHRVWKGIYGIEIPVSQFKSLLSSGKSDSTKANTSSQSKTSSK